MILADDERAMLDGRDGPALARAMDLLVRYGEALGAQSRPALTRDYISAPITMRRNTHGAKPDAFCYWLFAILGMRQDDTFADLFPGSGAVTDAWGHWRDQTTLGAPRESPSMEAMV